MHKDKMEKLHGKYKALDRHYRKGLLTWKEWSRLTDAYWGELSIINWWGGTRLKKCRSKRPIELAQKKKYMNLATRAIEKDLDATLEGPAPDASWLIF